MPMRRFIAAALAATALSVSPTLAADLFGSAPAPMSMQGSGLSESEVGTNWYLRGDIGYMLQNDATIIPSAGLIPQILTDPLTGVKYVNAPIGDAGNPVSATRGNNQSSRSASFDVGLGYRYNDYLRLEATYNFFHGPGLGYAQSTLCPNTTSAVSNYTYPGGVPTPVPVGYLWAPTACNGYLNASQYNNLLLGSAYIDLGNYWGVTPYIGAGAGLNANTVSGSTSFFNASDGSPFLGNTSATAGAPLVNVTQTGVDAQGHPIYTPLGVQPQVAFGTQNWNRTISSTKYTIAGALMAGIGYQLSPSATLDIGYRYISTDLLGSTRNSNQEVHVGVRYMAN